MLTARIDAWPLDVNKVNKATQSWTIGSLLCRRQSIHGCRVKIVLPQNKFALLVDLTNSHHRKRHVVPQVNEVLDPFHEDGVSSDGNILDVDLEPLDSPGQGLKTLTHLFVSHRGRSEHPPDVECRTWRKLFEDDLDAPARRELKCSTQFSCFVLDVGGRHDGKTLR